MSGNSFVGARNCTDIMLARISVAPTHDACVQASDTRCSWLCAVHAPVKSLIYGGCDGVQGFKTGMLESSNQKVKLEAAFKKIHAGLCSLFEYMLAHVTQMHAAEHAHACSAVGASRLAHRTCLHCTVLTPWFTSGCGRFT